MRHVVFALVLAAVHASCTSVYVEVGPDVHPDLATRMRQLLTQANGTLTTVLPPPLCCCPAVHQQLDGQDRSTAALVLLIGETAQASLTLPDHTVASLPLDGFITTAQQIHGAVVVTARAHQRNSSTLATAYAQYAVLEVLGFGFLHPLEPVIPDHLDLASALALNGSMEAPYWPYRGSGLHAVLSSRAPAASLFLRVSAALLSYSAAQQFSCSA